MPSCLKVTSGVSLTLDSIIHHFSLLFLKVPCLTSRAKSFSIRSVDMSVFEAYREEVSLDIRSISQLISELRDSLTSKDGKSCNLLEQEINRFIVQANLNISMMNLEAQSANDVTARNSLKKIVTFQQNSIRSLKADFEWCVSIR